MGNLLCMGLFLGFMRSPPPGSQPYRHGLPARMHMDMLHGDLLLALATMTIERIQQHGIGSREFVGLAQVFSMALERLFPDHGAPVALHRRVVRSEQLSRHHAFKLVLWSNPR